MSEECLGLDINEIIVNSFLGYKYRKDHGILYSVDSKVPISLIKLYYSPDNNRTDFDILKRSFIKKYIKSESELEGIHDCLEVEGLASMYEYAHSIPRKEFEMFSLVTLHRQLYSKCPYPEAGGRFRNRNVYLPGTGTETCDYSDIFDQILLLEDAVTNLMSAATQMRETNDYSHIFEFVNTCLMLKCRLIKIHPFDDGNGRTVRCFINRIFEEAGIPPVYIKANERTEYHLAMNEANNEGNYSTITNFYLYKICDSIIELDVNEQVKKERQQLNAEKNAVKAKRLDSSKLTKKTD